MSKEERQSALKPSSEIATHREPLGGSPVQQGPPKVARTSERVEMEGVSAVSDSRSQNYATKSFTAIAKNDAFKDKEEKWIDSPIENSFPCGTCYLPTCKDCCVLPCVVAAVAKATAHQIQNSNLKPSKAVSYHLEPIAVITCQQVRNEISGKNHDLSEWKFTKTRVF